MDDQQAASQPLLSNANSDPCYAKKRLLPRGFAWILKWILKLIIWAVFVAWVIFIFLYQLNSVNTLVKKWTHYTSSTFLGIEGAMLLLFSGPVLVIALLSMPLLAISGEEDEIIDKKIRSEKHPGYRLWTYPVIVDGPLGVVSAAEMVGIFVFLAFLIWAAFIYTFRNLANAQDESILMLEFSGISLGVTGIFCLAFLFLPVARGSVLLRLLDIPFDHASRYHIWLGHLTMLIFTLHGLSFIISWSLDGNLLHQIFQWQSTGTANFAGVISLATGLMMWVTSLPPVRKKYFELFYYTHHLYVIFVVFLAFHVGEVFFSIVAAGVLLFMLDRFLRLCQSRSKVQILSATSLPCGVLKLVLSKPTNLRYNALSFIFLQIQQVSSLQWHPFSISSGPLDDGNHISVLIKVRGEWTTKLKENLSENVCVSNEEHFHQCSELTASVEGPYGPEFPYYLMYEKIVLAAGGIGISPFLAVLSDIVLRIRQGKSCLVKNVLLVWAVKTSPELLLLSTADIMESIYRVNSPNKLNLEILIYVTQETEPPLPLEGGRSYDQKDMNSKGVRRISKYSMSVLVGTGDKTWPGLYVVSTVVGFFLMQSLIHIFYINPCQISIAWYQGLLLLASMVASVLIFGGLLVGFWHHFGIKTSEQKERREVYDTIHDNGTPDRLAGLATTHYGSRPDFKDIFGRLGERWGYVDVGVIACGPRTLESSVAKECRSTNLNRRRHQPVFHFISHAFEL